MRWYWTKIVLGAAAVFVVGYAGVLAVRRAIDTGRMVFESADPITLPLAFLPFAVEGTELGTFQRVTIRREAPEVITGIDLRVKVPDGAVLPDLADCRLTPVGRRQLEIDAGFRCLPADASDSALVPFGEIRFRRAGQDDVVVPFLLDSAVVAELRSRQGVAAAQRVFSGSEAEAARQHAEEVTTRVRVRVDSVTNAVRIKVDKAPPAGPPPPPEQ